MPGQMMNVLEYLPSIHQAAEQDKTQYDQDSLQGVRERSDLESVHDVRRRQ